MKNFKLDEITKAINGYFDDIKKADKVISKVQNEILNDQKRIAEAKERIEKKQAIIADQNNQKFKMIGAVEALNDVKESL